MAWGDLTNSQMVSFNDIQGSGVSLKSGQVAISTDQCITKAEALTMYNINTLAVEPYASNQLIPKSIISYVVCNPSAFTSVAQGQNWAGLAATPNGDVYAIVSAGDIYKQTGGTGAFVSLNQGSRNWNSIAAAPNGDVYAVADFDPALVYKQTGGSGNFTALSIPQRDYYSVTIAPNGDVYLATQAGTGEDGRGDIYKQTGGTGDFVSLNQRQYWSRVVALPSGDIYATLYQGDIYKQTGGTGDFVPQNLTSRKWIGLAGSANGDVYGAEVRGLLYKQTAGVGEFAVINYSNQPNLNPSVSDIYGVTVTPSGGIYICDRVDENIYKADIVCTSACTSYRFIASRDGSISWTSCAGTARTQSTSRFGTYTICAQTGTQTGQGGSWTTLSSCS